MFHVYVRAFHMCVRACVRVCACERACVRVCVFVCPCKQACPTRQSHVPHISEHIVGYVGQISTHDSNAQEDNMRDSRPSLSLLSASCRT